jgi:cytoskeletal protein CcmA (bactofilin family)
MKIYGAQLTGSIASTGNPVVTGSLTVSGNLTAQQFIVSSSVTFLTTSFSSGSTKFGDTIDDTHQFTGSLSVTGSQTINGTLGVSIGGVSELNVQQTGVILGNLITDAHRVTGSLNISGSVATTGVATFLSSVSVNGGSQPLSNGIHTYFSSSISYIDSLQAGVAWRDLSIAGNDLFFKSGGIERMRINSAGLVGVGTTSPNGGLTVVAPTTSTAISLWGRPSDNFSALRFQSNSGASTYATIYSDASNLIFENGGSERMRILNGGNVLIGTTTDNGSKLQVTGAATFSNTIKFSSIATTDYSVSFSGIGAGAWYNLTAVNFSGFNGLVTISIQNDNASYGYTVRASAWIFQTGINGDNIYSGLRSVTIRPDGVSYEGINVVESYHTAPTSGRYNIRMRLRVRDAGLAAANPLNLQIWVDSITSFPASGTLSLKAI